MLVYAYPATKEEKAVAKKLYRVEWREDLDLFVWVRITDGLTLGAFPHGLVVL